ncbi:bifunctional DNA primase/polymerase [Streptomyces sp. LaPpAH-108]|uniref:bifunctional DNA primase/polymerase n=1 Tax=Streptomyces sp. LaPpAH-108 TaxID=1155714 RepID=UPI0003600756|nr:bifunctional DNA primase/polymerase [Streptomyces sp. LaPpAH-108]
MTDTSAGPGAAQIPHQRTESLLETAVRYADERRWDVVAGSWLETVGGMLFCSCGDGDCPAPGAHPTRPDWATLATRSVKAVRGMWQRRPTASILLPTGRTFDALSVPEGAGLLALARMERMGLIPGPVIRTTDRRAQFFVLPGGSTKAPDLLRRLGWYPASLDLTSLGEGRYVTAPPSRVGTRGAAQWAAPPTLANRWLPDAEEVIPALAYACGRDR